MNQVFKKSLIYILEYWVIFVGIPFLLVLSAEGRRYSFDWPGYMMFYILFFAPIVFIFFYLSAKTSLINKVQKFYFILFGLVIPHSLLIFFVLRAIRNAFDNSSFPF